MSKHPRSSETVSSGGGRDAAPLVIAAAAAVLVVAFSSRPEPKPVAAPEPPPPPPPEVSAPVEPPRREPEKISAVLRKKGFHECNPHDPVGLGPYAPYRTIAMGGRFTAPQKGGHTADWGYDVLVHFHGHEPLRKTLVQVSRGIVYVGFDKGLGSGPYSNAFPSPDQFEGVYRSITAALRDHAGTERAHIRHLALSAWSAGYGAINEILEYEEDDIDAVVLLDGLHAGWNPATRGMKRRPKGVAAVSAAPIQPVFDFARRAMKGEKIFVFTHSHVDPVDYPATDVTADLMLSELGLKRTPVKSTAPYGMTGRVDVKGFHLWTYAGHDEMSHCDHIGHISAVLQDVLEKQWKTPLMDRDVPPTPAPVLGGGDEDAGSPDGGEADAGGAADDDAGTTDAVDAGPEEQVAAAAASVEDDMPDEPEEPAAAAPEPKKAPTSGASPAVAPKASAAPAASAP